MAERIVSPGVFTQENDLSFLPVGIGEIGAAIIGRTARGPAFQPTVIRSTNEFELKFGSETAGTYVPYTVREYLKSAGAVTIVRVLGLNGYGATLPQQVYLIASQSDAIPYILGLVHASSRNSTQQAGDISFGSSPSGGTFATASISCSIDVNLAAVSRLTEFQIAAEGTTYRFIGANPSAIPADQHPLYYYATGSTGTATIANLAAEINGATTITDLVTAVASESSVNLTANKVGTTANGYLISTGSAEAAITTFVNIAAANTSTSFQFDGGVANTGNGYFYDSINGSSITTLSDFANSDQPFSSSFDKTNANYFKNVLAVDPGRHVPTAGQSALEKSYVYSLFNSQSYGAMATNKGGGYSFLNATAVTASVNFHAAAATVTGTTSTTSGKQYQAACTPWVLSQKLNGAAGSPLFKFHTLSHGNGSNKICKVSIVGIKKAGSISGQDHGSFTVLVRKFDDTDTKVVSLESHTNCNLNPSSPNYLARIIGDQYQEYANDSSGNAKLVVKGNYRNMSRYVRVEMHENSNNAVYSDTLIPFGHEPYISPFSLPAYTHPHVGIHASGAAYPKAALVTSRSLDTDTKTYFGFNFNETILKNGMENYLAPLSGDASIGTNTSFFLESCQVTGSTVTVDSALHAKKFSLAFQGGFDGVNPATQIAMEKDMLSTNTLGMSFASTTTDGYVAYKKALDSVGNPDEIDINMIVMPGILAENASNIVAKIIDTCENRGDCFYVMDGVNSTSGKNTINATANADLYDTSYAATYFPWVKILDATVNRFVWVPPSVVVPGVIAYNDKVAFPWFAPAGLNRGSLNSVIDVYSRLTHNERDDLYEGKVNPIAVFPNTGVCVWGQKTLQTKPSALDRINVRRLLIKLKKFIASSTKYLVFENNTTATRNRFLNIVNPYLETVQAQQGLYAFKVVMDESNNTPDVIDRNQMKGEIFLQPAKAAEFIIVDFNIMRTGASFEE